MDKRKSFQYFALLSRVGVIEVSQSHFMYNSNESTKHDFIVLSLHFNTFDGPFHFQGRPTNHFFFLHDPKPKENKRENTLNNEEVAISSDLCWDYVLQFSILPVCL